MSTLTSSGLELTSKNPCVVCDSIRGNLRDKKSLVRHKKSFSLIFTDKIADFRKLYQLYNKLIDTTFCLLQWLMPILKQKEQIEWSENMRHFDV